MDHLGDQVQTLKQTAAVVSFQRKSASGLSWRMIENIGEFKAELEESVQRSEITANRHEAK